MDASNDASGRVDAQADTGSDAAAACHALTNQTDAVTQEVIAADPPASTGGTIVDGTYVFTH